MSLFKRLLRLARAVVENVANQLTQQINIVQEGALSPMRAIVQSVTGGVWRGDGADAFVEEVSSLMIPGVGQVSNHISVLHKNLTRAVEVINQADQQVNTKVNSLSDIFDGIYSG